MNKRILCIILVQILVLISSKGKDSMSLEIHRSKSHFDQTGDLTPLVVTLSSEDKTQKIKGVDLICIVDVSGSMSGDKIKLVKESLEHLVKLMNEEDNLALITFSSDAEVINELTPMTQENKTDLLKNIDNLYAYGGTNIYPALEKALDLIAHDYSTGERIASIILLSDGQDNYSYNSLLSRFENLLETTNKTNYAFTLHTFGYGEDHDEEIMLNLAKIQSGSFLFVNDLADVQDFYLKIYGSLSTICNVNLNLTIQSSYTIKNISGIDDLYKASLSNKTDTNNKTILFSFNTVLIQVVSGKKYSYVVLVDIPKDTPFGTEVLNATVSPLGLNAKYLWDQKLNSIAYEEYIKNISVTYFSMAFYRGVYSGRSIIEEGLKWITINYIGTINWVEEFNAVLIDFDNYYSFGRANLLSKIYELKTSNIGIHYSIDNSYVKTIIDRSHNIDVSNLPLIRVVGEKIINFEININYYYFYLKDGSGTINNLYFSGEGSSLIIYSDNPSGKIKISSLSQYIEYYYWNETKIRSQNVVDFSRGGKFIMEKDFPYEFYTRVDGTKDITFNIEFLKFEYVEKIEISEHLFEIIAYVIDDQEIDNLSNSENYVPTKTVYNGYYNSLSSLGTIVIKKEEIVKYKVSSSIYNYYLYVIIKKSPKVSITYNHVEGQFIFVSMDYIYSTIPAGFMISSHLSEGQKTPHLYTFDGRNITIEMTYFGKELVCKIIKYKLYQTGSEELYVDYSQFIINRRVKMDKIYIDVIQKIQENEENEGNTTSNKLIVSIFSNNTGHVAGDNITSLSYSMRYETHPFIETELDNGTDFTDQNYTDIIYDNDTNIVNNTDMTNTDAASEKKSDIENNDPNQPPIRPKANVFLLGFAKFIYVRAIKISYFSVYFARIREVIYTKILIITVKIKYRLSLRRLEDNSESKQAECTLLDNKFENIDNFNCTLETNGEEIENMQIEKYDFQDQQVGIIGETSISKAYKNNLQNVGDNDIFNKKLYILDNATRSIDNEHNEFNITGTINDKSFNYENVKLSLNSENEKPQDISCKVIKKDDNNYILNCKTDDQMKAELDGVFADLGNENLIVNFVDEGNSTINFEQNYDGVIYSKKKKRIIVWCNCWYYYCLCRSINNCCIIGNSLKK
jgi:Mg-chelatase subunit ChlD